MKGEWLTSSIFAGRAKRCEKDEMSSYASYFLEAETVEVL